MVGTRHWPAPDLLVCGRQAPGCGVRVWIILVKCLEEEGAPNDEATAVHDVRQAAPWLFRARTPYLHNIMKRFVDWEHTVSVFIKGLGVWSRQTCRARRPCGRMGTWFYMFSAYIFFLDMWVLCCLVWVCYVDWVKTELSDCTFAGCYEASGVRSGARRRGNRIQDDVQSSIRSLCILLPRPFFFSLNSSWYERRTWLQITSGIYLSATML
jgi:hypothetical protein